MLFFTFSIHNSFTNPKVGAPIEGSTQVRGQELQAPESRPEAALAAFLARSGEVTLPAVLHKPGFSPRRRTPWMVHSLSGMNFSHIHSLKRYHFKE